MACASCNHKGFLEYNIQRDGRLQGVIMQCRKCDDIRAYSDEVSRRHHSMREGLDELEQIAKDIEKKENVLPFKKKES